MKKIRQIEMEEEKLCYFLKNPYNYIQRMVNI